MSIESLTAQVRDFARERAREQFHTPKNLTMAPSGEAGELIPRRTRPGQCPEVHRAGRKAYCGQLGSPRDPEVDQITLPV